MTNKENNDAQSSPSSTVQAILGNRALTWTIVGLASLIVIVVTFLTVSAYRQGRKVSIAGFVEIEAQPTSAAAPAADSPTPSGVDADNNLIPIEAFPGELFSFSGDAYGQLTVIRKLDGELDYRLNYEMPQDGSGYAGAFFAFGPTIDLTEFTAIQTTINFSDADAICEIYLEDQESVQSYITLGDDRFDNASDDARMEIQGTDRIFTIPLSANFLLSSNGDALNKQSVAGLGFGVNGSHTSGAHNCTIQEIYFVK